MSLELDGSRNDEISRSSIRQLYLQASRSHGLRNPSDGQSLSSRDPGQILRRLSSLYGLYILLNRNRVLALRPFGGPSQLATGDGGSALDCDVLSGSLRHFVLGMIFLSRSCVWQHTALTHSTLRRDRTVVSRGVRHQKVLMFFLFFCLLVFLFVGRLRGTPPMQP